MRAHATWLQGTWPFPYMGCIPQNACFIVSGMVPKEPDDIFADWGYQHFAKQPVAYMKADQDGRIWRLKSKRCGEILRFRYPFFFLVLAILFCSALLWGGSHRLRASMCLLSCERCLVDQRFEGSCVDSWFKFVDSCDLSSATLLILGNP